MLSLQSKCRSEKTDFLTKICPFFASSELALPKCRLFCWLDGSLWNLEDWPNVCALKCKELCTRWPRSFFSPEYLWCWCYWPAFYRMSLAGKVSKKRLGYWVGPLRSCLHLVRAAWLYLNRMNAADAIPCIRCKSGKSLFLGLSTEQVSSAYGTRSTDDTC